MKKVVLVLLSLISANAIADQYVNGYTRSNGTYVEPYVRSSPNSTTADNYGSRSNNSGGGIYDSIRVPTVSAPTVSAPTVEIPSISSPSVFDR